MTRKFIAESILVHSQNAFHVTVHRVLKEEGDQNINQN